MKKLYIDVDGVLLTTKNTQPAEDSTLFINFITKEYDCYWLTTHCKGNNKTVLNYLSPYFETETLSNLTHIKPTNWDTLKTEVIDFSAEFYWIDDQPLQNEIEVLKKQDALDRLIIVDLKKQGELKRIINMLRR